MSEAGRREFAAVTVLTDEQITLMIRALEARSRDIATYTRLLGMGLVDDLDRQEIEWHERATVDYLSRLFRRSSSIHVAELPASI